MSTDVHIAKPFEVSTGTGGSFEQELRQFLQGRCTKCMGMGLALSVLMLLVSAFLIQKVSHPISSFITASKPVLSYGHAASFALALLVIYLIRRRATARKLQVIAFLTFAFNILLAVFIAAGCRPDYAPFFEMALLAFIPAAFIPWPVGFQIGLGATGLVAYAATQVLTFLFVPGYQAYWYESASIGFTNAFVWGTTGMAILGAVASHISFSLYSLRKTAHKAARLGNYVIMEELGKGGMGKVYLARHALMCRPTAVKVMHSPDSDAQSAIARFEREVNLSARLTHPNTINIYDYGRTGEDVFYYAMEFLEGLDLQALVERFGPLPPERIVFVVRQVCGSLAEAHDRGIIHRDIKPSNIFLTHRGGLFDFVKVLDFGLAKVAKTEGSAALTKTGIHVGTPRYIAPEALMGRVTVDGRSDIYNLGAVIYWMLSGQPPFASSSSIEAIVDHVKTIPHRPSEICELPIPKALDDIVMRCLEKDPEDRFPTAMDLERALAAISFEEPWSYAAAKSWWDLHGLSESRVPECTSDVDAAPVPAAARAQRGETLAREGASRE